MGCRGRCRVGVALELLMMMEPDLARNPILTDTGVSPETVGNSRLPLHLLLCFGKWDNAASWGFHEPHRWKVLIETFIVIQNSLSSPRTGCP